MVRRTISFILRKIAGLGIVWPFVYLYASKIEEVKPQVDANQSNKLTILALNPDRFREDLQILANSGEFRVLKVPVKWQTKVLSLFWSKEFKIKRRADPDKYYNPNGDPYFLEIQANLRKFLKKFLSSLYARLKIDCVIGAGAHYIQDFDWGLVSDELGVPYIVMHRENLATAPRHIKRVDELFGKKGAFRGSHIIVHNQVMKESFIESGYVNSEQISALGCLRMDGYVNKIKEHNGHQSTHRRKQVVLFSFNHATGLLGILNSFSKDRSVGLVNFFEHVHVAMAELALENKEVDFIIKPKWGSSWIDEIEYAFQKYGIQRDEISNLKIVVDTNVHDLILESDVICGYGSTTLLEAAIATKPVILPFFDEVLKPEYSDYIHYKNELHLFDVANSPEEFKELIIKRLHNPQIDEVTQVERYATFEKYVSSMNADALDKYVKAIKKVVHQSKT